MHLNPDQAARLADELLKLDPDGAETGSLELVGVPRTAAAEPGTRLGNYRIGRLLGVGGMGEVYEAEQESTRRRVALKLVRGNILTPELRRRFDHEVRILASLQHPGIAQIYEAGQMPTPGAPDDAAHGVPYFAMEFIEGQPLTTFASTRNLSLRNRLELFLRVCVAVEHAHQKGVIHRDLKPANILVAAPSAASSAPGAPATSLDPLGHPKVLDFGVARAIDSDVAVTSVHTEMGKLIGTLPYMSPEQTDGHPADLDTRSDVYALGVVLYELLSGKLPYELKGDAGARVANALRVIKEVDPTPLSTIDRVFRGDLETIVAKALEKDRERRYQSVGELAADIRRYLDDQPIIARRASTWYELRKFARRNRAATMVGCAAMVAVTLAAGVAGWGYWVSVEARADAEQAENDERAQRIEAELRREEARREAAASKGVLELVRAMILDAAPANSGHEVTMLQVLRGVEERSRASLDVEPIVRGKLLLNVAELYLALERSEEGLDVGAQGLALLRDADGKSRMAGEYIYASLLTQATRYKEALEQVQDLLTRQVAALPPDDPDIAATTMLLSTLYSELGDYPKAIEAGERAIKGTELAWGPRHRKTMLNKASYATTLQAAGRAPEAERILREVLAQQTEHLGPKHADRISTLSNLATLLSRLMRLDEAEPLCREVMDVYDETYEIDDPRRILAANNLAVLLGRKNDHAGAAVIFRKNLAANERLYGRTHERTLSTMSSLAYTLEMTGARAEAQSLYREAIAGQTINLGEHHPETLQTRFDLANCLMDDGDLANARIEFERLVEATAHLTAQKEWYAAIYGIGLGRCLAKMDQYDAARDRLLASYQTLDKMNRRKHPMALMCAEALAQLFERAGHADEAAAWRSKQQPQ